MLQRPVYIVICSSSDKSCTYLSQRFYCRILQNCHRAI